MFESRQKKYKKYFKIIYSENNKKVQDHLTIVGNYGLKATESCYLKTEQLNCILKTIKRVIKKKNIINLRVFPDLPITMKPKDVRMGRGKGSPSHKVYPLKAGKIIVELNNVPENLCQLAFKSCAIRLPVITKIVKRYDKRTDSFKSS